MVSFKRVLILKQLSSACSVENKVCCGVAKLEYTDSQTLVKVALSNVTAEDRYSLVCRCGKHISCWGMVGVADNFTLPRFNVDDYIDCVIFSDRVATTAVLFGTTRRDMSAPDLQLLNATKLGGEQTVERLDNIESYKQVEIDDDYSSQGAGQIAVEVEQSNSAKVVLPQSSLEVLDDYEKFIVATDNFYDREQVVKPIDIQEIKNKANEKFSVVKEYSNAFEQYYAVKRGDGNYYTAVKEQLQNVFDAYAPYTPLINKVANSYWVKIDYPSSDKYFILGLISNDDTPSAIAYALPCHNREETIDNDFVYREYEVGSGKQCYYILYQDAQTGHIKK